MTAEVENLIPERLKAFQAWRAHADRKFEDILSRLTVTEQHMARLHLSDIRHNQAVDAVNARLDRIERRCDLKGGGDD